MILLLCCLILLLLCNWEWNKGNLVILLNGNWLSWIEDLLILHLRNSVILLFIFELKIEFLISGQISLPIMWICDNKTQGHSMSLTFQFWWVIANIIFKISHYFNLSQEISVFINKIFTLNISVTLVFIFDHFSFDFNREYKSVYLFWKCWKKFNFCF